MKLIKTSLSHCSTSYQRGRLPPLLPKEHLILERRKQEELREEANAVVTYNKQFDLKVNGDIGVVVQKLLAN